MFLYAGRMERWDSNAREAMGRRLAHARTERGLTQTQVGTLFGLTKGAVSAWEVGTNMPDAEQVARMADEFGVSVEWLILGLRSPPLAQDTLEALSRLDAAERIVIENGMRFQLALKMLPFGKDQQHRA
jgi:transcriptional regulator with XRE-family HTH domain